MNPTRTEGDFLVPAGTVTFLLTDVEGSTRAWESDRDAMAQAMARLDEIISDAIGAHAGVRPVEQGEGDSAVAAFAHASDALACALEIQRRLAADMPNIRVRIGMHTGEAQRRDSGNYFAQSINRAARIRSLAHGGQTLLSRATHDLVLDRLPEDVHLEDVGTHRLRDLARPEHVYQLLHPDLPSAFPPIRSLDTIPNNLPIQLTSFIGREREVADIRRLHGEGRLVTLTGSGGCGKTRLALQTAAELLDSHPDGVWFVELGPLDDARLVPNAVAAACSVKEIPGKTLSETLARDLKEKRALLVLDNCEHMIPACAELARALLTSCPALSVVATSREPIGIEGEVTWRVPSLTLPSETDPPRIEALTQYEAVRLFIDRAKRARPNFAITDENAPAVAQICHRLEGIPLAIELAAARTRMMGAEQILSGLADRFRLLTGGSRTALPRQQTLEASVDWSHALLSDNERALLRRLSVLAGSFTLDAAEAVAAAEVADRYAVLDLLSDLVDKSLVQVEGDERYRLLETVRIFAARKLADEEEETTGVRDRHLSFYVTFAERAEREMEHHDVLDWLGRVTLEHSNVRAALDWAMESEHTEAAQELTGRLCWYWLLRCHLSEGRQRCEHALALHDPVRGPSRCRALFTLAILLSHFYENEAQEPVAEEAVAVARELGDGLLLGRALCLLADARGWRNHPNASATYKEALETALASKDAVAHALALLASAQYDFFVGDLDAAVAKTQEGVEVSRSAGFSWGLLYNALNLAAVKLFSGELDDAEHASLEAMELARALGDRGWEGALLGYRGMFALLRGQYAEARVQLEESRRVGAEHPGMVFTDFWAGLFDYATESGNAVAVLSAAAARMRVGSVALYAMCLGLLGRARLAAGDVHGARADFEECVAASREPWLPSGAAGGLHGLALLARTEGNLERSETLAHEALTAAVPALGLITADVLELLAGLAALQESGAESARLFGAAQAFRDLKRFARFPVAQRTYEADVVLARKLLPDDAFQVAWVEGAELSLEDAVSYANRGRGERKRPSSGWASLTPAELQVVPLVAEHLTNAEIGARLFMSPATVKTHLQHIYAKLGIASRAELGADAIRRGLA